LGCNGDVGAPITELFDEERPPWYCLLCYVFEFDDPYPIYI